MSSPVAPVVVKIGTSSLTDADGRVRAEVIDKLADEVAGLRADGRVVLIVTSGAISAGLPTLGLDGAHRPTDSPTLQAASAVGQSRLMAVYDRSLARHGIIAGQILLAPLDFFERSQYLHARQTLSRLIELGVVPIINENDAIADDAIRFGDNDRIAALVAHLIGAERLILLTDTSGIFTNDPRSDPNAEIVAELTALDDHSSIEFGGPGTARGSGGMASKVAAAKMAAWSGVSTVIANAARPNVLAEAVAETPGVGTIVRPQPHPLSARKLWIAFALEPTGRITVDEGAVQALTTRGGSLLAVGVSRADGTFNRGDAVDVFAPDGRNIARGLTAMSIVELRDAMGIRGSDQPGDVPREVIHRDELVVLG